MSDGRSVPEKIEGSPFTTGDFKNLNEGPPTGPGDLPEAEAAAKAFGGLKRGPTYSTTKGPAKVPMLKEVDNPTDMRGLESYPITSKGGAKAG